MNTYAGPAEQPRRTAEEEALLDRAKERLMASQGLTEAQAHRWLQKQSMDKGVKMVEMARQVLQNN